MTRSGFVAVAGRPNVGKSTLVNSIVGTKVAVTSDKPQTTRRAIRGIANGEREGERWQLVLVDLPGVQRPLDPLTERMQGLVERQLGECDAVLFVVSGTEKVGAGDRFIAKALASSPVPVIAAVNKVDAIDRGATVAALDATARLEAEGVVFQDVFPISARTGAGLDQLLQSLVRRLPEGPLYYPDDARSDLRQELAIAELVREQALARTREEVPHSVEVEVQEVHEVHERPERPEAADRDGLTEIKATLWVETQSQKGILIGREGAMIREIGTGARAEIERLLGGRVFLDLTVKVRKGWRRDEGLLDRLGIEG